MITGFEKIVEERIRHAQRKGEFNALPGSGQPMDLAKDRHVPEDLRLAYKILKNADCLPPEVELKKEIDQAEDLLAHMEDEREKYSILKKINFLVMKLNTLRGGKAMFEVPQHYTGKLAQRITTRKTPAPSRGATD